MLKNKKNYFVDVVIIRLSLIFLLVFYHSFAIYSRNWSSPFSFLYRIYLYTIGCLYVHMDFNLKR